MKMVSVAPVLRLWDELSEREGTISISDSVRGLATKHVFIRVNRIMRHNISEHVHDRYYKGTKI